LHCIKNSVYIFQGELGEDGRPGTPGPQGPEGPPGPGGLPCEIILGEECGVPGPQGPNGVKIIDLINNSMLYTIV
jgi:hypothetical protein